MAPDYNPNDINAVFSRLETLLNAQAETLEEIKSNTAKLQERITKLEGWNWKQIGFIAGVSSTITLVFALLKTVLL